MPNQIAVCQLFLLDFNNSKANLQLQNQAIVQMQSATVTMAPTYQPPTHELSRSHRNVILSSVASRWSVVSSERNIICFTTQKMFISPQVILETDYGLQ